MSSYGLKTVPKLLCVLMHMLLGFSRNDCVGMACMPHLDYRASAVQAARSIGRSSFIISSINLVNLKAV